MDNRNNHPEYTDISAQRRHRRVSAPEREPEKVSPAEPEEAGRTAAEEAGWEPVTVPESEPVTPEKPETAPPAEEAPEPETRETETSGDAEETPEAVQAADSRVPPEARRMAAAPYGIARPGAKRPGTRPMVAPRRPPLEEEKKDVVQTRRPAPAPIREPEETPQARNRGNRVRVGYAPGRMSDGMTRQVPPAQETVREPLPSRDARAYLEKRRQPFRTETREDPVPAKPVHRILRIATVLLLAIGVFLTIVLAVKGGNGRDGRIKREAPQVISFDSPDVTEGLTAPQDLPFSAVTDKDVESIRFYAEGQQVPQMEASFVDNTDGRFWMMNLRVEYGFTGTVVLQVRRNEEEGWYDTAHTVKLDVAKPIITPTPEEARPTETPTPNSDVVFADTGTTGTAEETPGPTELPGETPAATDGTEAETVTEQPAEETGNPDGTETTDEPEEETGDDENNWPQEETIGGEDDLPSGGELRTVQPTFTPEPQAAKPTATPPLTAEAVPEANPDLITSTVVYDGKKKVKNYNRAAKDVIQMPVADEYAISQLGVITFRGDNFRRNAAAARLKDTPVGLEVLWEMEGGSARGTNQTYYGYGWTGQPLIARWSTQVRSFSNIDETVKERKALKEVIIAGLDGNIRFYDLETGKLTRNSIRLGYPMRGTPSLDSRGAPFLTVGQFARKMKSKTGKIGLRQYNLFTQKELKMIDGLDPQYHRALNNVGSFETSALIDRVSDTLIIAGTNGMLYLESLDSTFDYNMGVYKTSMSSVVMVSKARGQKNTALTAVESSLAAYDKYVFYADMGGVLRCVDTNTLTPVWAVETGDSVMAAVALDLTENRELNLYTANMLNNRKKGDSSIQIRRYDALSGREAWCTDIGVYKDKKDKDDVGAKASPVIGQYGLNDLVYFTVTGLNQAGRDSLGLTDGEPAALIALYKDSGKVAWAYGLSSRSESSPVAVYDQDGNGWILQCEQNGTIHLLTGLDGRVVDTLKVAGDIEASPAAYMNVMVVGSTGKNTSFVYGIRLKYANPTVESEGENNEEDPGST